MTTGELKTTISSSDFVEGKANHIDASVLNRASSRVIDYFDPATGQVSFENFFTKVVEGGTSLMDFENYFSSQNIKAGELVFAYDEKFLNGLLIAKQSGESLVPLPAISGSVGLNTNGYTGTARSHSVDVSNLTNGVEYVVKFFRDNGIIYNPIVNHGKYSMQQLGGLNFGKGVIALPFVKLEGEDEVLFLYSEYLNGSNSSLNYVVRLLRATDGVNVDKVVYHTELNSEIMDFVFTIIPLDSASNFEKSNNTNMDDGQYYLKINAVPHEGHFHRIGSFVASGYLESLHFSVYGSGDFESTGQPPLSIHTFLMASNGRILSPRGYLATSDIRLKRNITPLNEDTLTELMQVNVVKHLWHDNEDKGKVVPEHFGIIAQELELVFPDLVQGSENEMLSVDYARLTVPLIKAVQQQQTQMQILKTEIEDIKEEILILKTLITNSN